MVEFFKSILLFLFPFNCSSICRSAICTVVTRLSDSVIREVPHTKDDADGFENGQVSSILCLIIWSSPAMNPMIWHKVTAVSGMDALGLGTYGAHMFKPENPSYKQVWQTASLYHLVHTAALVSAPNTKYPNIFGGLLTAGIVAFTGT